MNRRVLFALLLAGIPTHAAADDIYRSVDEKGRVRYSTNPKRPASEKQALPSLKKENWDNRIKTIKEQTPTQCDSHGGVNCSAGADDDGSVVCSDGFRDTHLTFSEQCLEARLKIDRPRFEEENGRTIAAASLATMPQRAVLTIRNLSPVEARGVEGTLNFRHKELGTFTGPQKIDPFSFADYSADLTNTRGTLVELRKAYVKMRCANCSAVTSALP